MRAIVWIALDILREGRSGAGPWWLILLCIVWMPFQMGMADGGVVGSPLWPDGLAFRRSLMMNGSWPATAIGGILLNVAFPRRLKGQLEPLLLTPIPDHGLFMGHALPVLAAGALAPVMMLAPQMLGYRLTSGAYPLPVPGELIDLALITQTAAVWLAVGYPAAILRARDHSGLIGRVFLEMLVLGFADLIAFLGDLLLGRSGWRGAILAMGILGGIRLAHTAQRIDRESLIMDRVDPVR